MKFWCLTLWLATAASVATAAAPPAGDVPGNDAFQAVLGCRAIDDPMQRLACFDQRSQALQAASEKRDIVIVDRKQVEEARRSLFGFRLPNLRLFGSGPVSSIVPEDQEISAKVRSAHQDADGDWIVTLDDGAVWHQTDDRPIGATPRSGMAVTIRRGALGSYFMRIDGRSGVKARREG